MYTTVLRTTLPALAVIALSVPAVSYAYTNLEIAVEFDDGRIEVDVDYDERGREVEREFVFNTTDLNEAYERTAKELAVSVATVKAAVVRIDRDDIDEDEDEDYDDSRTSDDDEKDDSYYKSSTRTDATEAIRDAKAEIAEAERFITKNQLETKARTALTDAKHLLTKAEKALASNTFGEAERLADRAESLAEDIVEGRLKTDTLTSKEKSKTYSSKNTDDTEAMQRQLLALLQQLIALLQAQSR
jgi:hypothetical protein